MQDEYAYRDDIVINAYKKDITKIPLLTFEEEKELAERVQNGDETAVNILVEHNLRLVMYVAKRYYYSSVPFNDLISEGNLGLFIAARNYNASERFATYAQWWIRAKITEFIRKYTAFERSDEQLVKDELYDSLLDDANTKYEECIERESDINAGISNLMKGLQDREKQIITLYYGLGQDSRAYSFKEIGSKTNLTSERVRQIHDIAIMKMKSQSLNCSDFDYFKRLM